MPNSAPASLSSPTHNSSPLVNVCTLMQVSDAVALPRHNRTSTQSLNEKRMYSQSPITMLLRRICIVHSLSLSFNPQFPTCIHVPTLSK